MAASSRRGRTWPFVRMVRRRAKDATELRLTHSAFPGRRNPLFTQPKRLPGRQQWRTGCSATTHGPLTGPGTRLAERGSKKMTRIAACRTLLTGGALAVAGALIVG